ncbi:hypothetical protein D1007_00079 [Hordeum vulgare]|nr:hypothetical protein D1007_00079 [Hordeum vulgare]
MIDDLINKIVKNDNTDDDFVRMTFLVLFGTVIAPVSHEYISKEYYALVKDKRMISKFNWNDFTLKFFLSEIGKVLEDDRVREWPHGNLALLQYAYWEKVQPIIGPKYDPLSLMSPLMRNWTEPVAEKRDKYDYDYGRGVGMGDWSDPIEVPDVSHEKAVTSLDTNEISSHESGHYNGVDEQVEKGIGKRKRTASRAIKSPFVVVKPIKRAKLSAKANGKKSSADVDVIKSSVMFVRACERSKKHKATQIFNDGVTDALTVERACQILKRQWISGDVMNAYSFFLLEEAKDERYIIPTWRVTWLLEYRKDKNVNGNEYQKVSNSNEPVNRCMNEYFKAPKTYMDLNKDDTHWVTVVMHKEKEEFQVLDSLMGKELDSTTRKLVEDLRREIGADIAEANSTGSVQYPDVSRWPIKTYDMPQQEDG